MFNHLVSNLSALSDAEIEEKILELSRKYFISKNPDLKLQISVVLDMFKEEARTRRAVQYQKTNGQDNSGLDNLINIS